MNKPTYLFGIFRFQLFRLQIFQRLVPRPGGPHFRNPPDGRAHGVQITRAGRSPALRVVGGGLLLVIVGLKLIIVRAVQSRVVGVERVDLALRRRVGLQVEVADDL